LTKLVFVLNEPSYFLSHRMAIGIEALEKGWDVHVAGPGVCPEGLLNTKITFHNIALSRKGKNPFHELKTILSLVSLFREVKPDLVHLITIKPYLYGGIAARITGVPTVISAVAGLGILFSSGDFKYKLLRLFLYPMYKLAFGNKNQKVIFQNVDDRDALLNWTVVSEEKPIMIRGSGVNLHLCSYLPEPKGIPIISFAARLLKDKGVEIFVEASKILQLRNVVARFWLIGEPDNGNTNSVTQVQVKQWESDGLVESFGFRKDIPSLFAQSNIVTLPSFYGEGLPKVLVEAAACGRAVITTNHPGCRDAIEANETGLLIPIRDAMALADAIEDLINNPDKRKQLGQSGRALAESAFAIEKIVDAHMQIYVGLLKSAEAIK
jgi:glycosyltransferase involved in cell wall biosynthesis